MEECYTCKLIKWECPTPVGCANSAHTVEIAKGMEDRVNEHLQKVQQLKIFPDSNKE